jgi:DNA-binding IclR family transcriptional regulator
MRVRKPLTPQPRRIGAIEVGFRLIRALEAADGAVALKDLSQRAGMPASKAHAYVASFVYEGLIVQDPLSGQYSLGPLAMQLGAAALRQSDLIEVARHEALGLIEATTSSVILNTWGNRGPTIVYRVEGKRRGPTSIRVGYVVPVWESATGRVFVAYLPESETQALLREETRGRVSAAAIRKSIEQIRRDGFAVAPDASNFAGFAAPVFDHDGRIVASLALSRPHEPPSRPMRVALGPVVRDAALRISLRLGYDASRQRVPTRQVRSRTAKKASPA